MYGSTRILTTDICWEWVEKLMRTAINKPPFYLQGRSGYETYTEYSLELSYPRQESQAITL